MFGSAIKYKVDRMERCCEKLTNIVESVAPMEQRISDNLESLQKDVSFIMNELSSAETKNDAKNKWIYDQLEALKLVDSRMMNKFYLVLGGVAVLGFILKFTDFSLKITQG